MERAEELRFYITFFLGLPAGWAGLVGMVMLLAQYQ